MKIYTKKNFCRSCGSKNLFKLLNLNKSPIGEDFSKNKFKIQKSYPLDLYMCKKCNLAQILDIINPKYIYKNYLYESKTSSYLEKHFKNYSEKIIKLFPNKKLFIVDIGSNDGMLLKYFKLKGHKILGIEPAKKISVEANKNNIPTINSFFSKNIINKILKKNLHPDVVTSNNVFANVENINDWTANIKSLIGEKGIWVIESFYLMDVIKNKVFDFIYHEHLSAFSVNSIINLCHNHGLELFRVEHVDTKGGSLRYFVRKKNKDLKIDKSVKIYLKKEVKFKLYKKKTFVQFEKFIKSQEKKIKIILNKNKKKQIVGFGASISCVTLMYQYRIENKFKYLLDDNKFKHGMYSPGSKILVKDPKEFVLSKNNILLILSWRFQKKILKKYSHKFKCRIIQVLPKIKIIKN